MFYNVSQQDFSIVSSTGASSISLTNISPLIYSDCFLRNGSAPQFAEMSLSVPFTRTITDVDLYQLSIDHTYIKDMRINLLHPDGTSVRVWNQNCDNQNNMLTSFDDESTVTAFDCPPVNGGFFQPSTNPLSGFDGQDAAGT
ncbi:MAG: subtilisin-like proprotein convertase family protein [Neolewinella sp.]